MTPTLIITTIAAYIALLFAVAFVSGRKSDNKGFFVGGRQSRWWVVMTAMVGAAMTGVSFVSVPGMVTTSGFAYMQMAIGFFVGYLIIAFVLVPLYFRLQLFSIYGYLNERLGIEAHKCGAWLFFISKLAGASVRLFVVCAVLQPLLFDPLGLPFWVNGGATVLLVWLYTVRGGVRSVIGTDLLRTACLVASVVASICVVVAEMDWGFGDVVRLVCEDERGQIFFTDNVNEERYFLKYIVGAIFIVVATTGLDQDMMQRSLSCRSTRDAQKNLIVANLLQTLVIFTLLVLGLLFCLFAEAKGITWCGGSDAMFPTIATSPEMPLAVGLLFILGLIASTYSAAGSALTALTTSFTLDLLGGGQLDEGSLTRLRKWVHAAMAVAMLTILIALYHIGNDSIIDTVYTLASYTYGPILGIFAFGLATRFKLHRRGLWLVVIAAPALSGLVQHLAKRWFDGYQIGYELLLINAALTFVGMLLLAIPRRK